MVLKDILSNKKDEPEYYWALVLEPGWVQAGLWRVQEEKTQIISTSRPMPWELEEELIDTVDTALSAAIQDFPQDSKEPKKAVFGVVSGWVKKGEIQSNYLELIKKVCSKLTLTPVGFVVLQEAIAHLIKADEGGPTNAVILGISKDQIEVSVFRLGKLTGTSQVARSLSIVDDAVEGLTRFGQKEPFPSRFMIHNGLKSELEEVKQALLKADWDDYQKIKFLHTPKIEVIDPKQKIHAVALAGASELADVTSVYSEKREVEKSEEEEEKTEELENVIPPEEIVSPEELGFALEKDVVTLDKPRPAPLKQPGHVEKEKKMTFGNAKISDIVVNAKEKLPKSFSMKLPSAVTFGSRKIILGVGFFIIVFVALFAFYWVYPKAEVTIYVSTKTLEEQVDIAVDPDVDTTDFGENILAGETLTKIVSGEKTKSTTGAKTVGEKSTGEITLYRVGSQIALAAGTELTGPGGLEFTLDDSVTIASGSAGSPGTTVTKVRANDIGAQYNLAPGSTFSVENYSVSDIEAKNGSAFSGGSSREISAVSLEDQDNLEEDLTQELKGRATKGLLQSLGGDKLLIEEALSSTPSSITFSNKVGDEADTLKLSLSLSVESVIIKKDDLYKLAEDALRDKIPEGFVLRPDQIDVGFDFEKVVDGKYLLTAKVSVNLLPKINPDEVKEKILGKYPPVVQDYLVGEIPGFSRAEIHFNKPRFPGRLGTLPKLVNNIEVIIASDK
ncbi:MAG: hypothetical protein ACC618_01445 [Patescibacteria group bacterium]